MHTCSHTTLALAAKQKQTFPGKQVTARQLPAPPAARPRGGFAGHELHAEPGTEPHGSAEPCRGSDVPWACFSALGACLFTCTNPRAAYC